MKVWGILARSLLVILPCGFVLAIVIIPPYFLGQYLYNLLNNQVRNPFEYFGAWLLGVMALCVATIIVMLIVLAFIKLAQLLYPTIGWIIHGDEYRGGCK